MPTELPKLFPTPVSPNVFALGELRAAGAHLCGGGKVCNVVVPNGGETSLRWNGELSKPTFRWEPIPYGSGGPCCLELKLEFAGRFALTSADGEEPNCNVETCDDVTLGCDGIGA